MGCVCNMMSMPSASCDGQLAAKQALACVQLCTGLHEMLCSSMAAASQSVMCNPTGPSRGCSAWPVPLQLTEYRPKVWLGCMPSCLSPEAMFVRATLACEQACSLVTADHAPGAMRERDSPAHLFEGHPGVRAWPACGVDWPGAKERQLHAAPHEWLLTWSCSTVSRHAGHTTPVGSGQLRSQSYRAGC